MENKQQGAVSDLSRWLGSVFVSPEQPPRNVLAHLFLASLCALYVEITLIRWISTEVRIFAYFQNLALIACFLGFGVGCYRAKRPKSVLLSLLAMTALVALVHMPSRIWKFFLTMHSGLLSLSSDAALWGFLQPIPRDVEVLITVLSALVVALFLLLLVAIMIPLGQWVGYYLDAAGEAVSAYSVDLLGSVVGSWVPVIFAVLWLPPGYWFALAFLVVLLVGPPSRYVSIAGIVLIVVTAFFFWNTRSGTSSSYWSPYQKLEVTPLGDQQYSIQVNNTGYMSIANVTPEFLARNPEIADRYQKQGSYDVPFRFALRRDRILVVGAGAGNDVAAALRNGAAHVDAVEIDPVIYSIGRDLHPERPYQASSVRTFITDARAFFRQATGTYDIILFGLLDSHTQFSDYSNMRIDSYVYTEEAFREARRLLGPEGVLVVKFEVRPPWMWMGERFFTLLANIFGRPPIAFYAPQLGALTGATVFIASDNPVALARAEEPELTALVATNPPSFPLTLNSALPVTTDDWPYVYHRDRSIPRTYLTVSAILLLLAVVLTRGAFRVRESGTWHFFLMGAGFLLLETQLVSRLALYFGATWVVNSVAITAILLVLVAANFYVTRWRPRRVGPYYALIVLLLLAVYAFPWHSLPYTARTVGILLSAAYALPIFFAGVVFIETFRRSLSRSGAFGANIVGAVAGGLAQNFSFILGIKALLLLAAVSYCGAALFGSRKE